MKKKSSVFECTEKAEQFLLSLPSSSSSTPFPGENHARKRCVPDGRCVGPVCVDLSEGGKQTAEGDKGRTCPSPPSSRTHTGAAGSARCKSASLHSSGERGDVRDGKEKIN